MLSEVMAGHRLYGPWATGVRAKMASHLIVIVSEDVEVKDWEKREALVGESRLDTAVEKETELDGSAPNDPGYHSYIKAISASAFQPSSPGPVMTISAVLLCRI